jgi:hypothetical protein
VPYPGKAVKSKSGSIQHNVVDVAESPINHKGKKRIIPHPEDPVVLLDRNSLEIIDVQEAKGNRWYIKIPWERHQQFNVDFTPLDRHH